MSLSEASLKEKLTQGDRKGADYVPYRPHRFDAAVSCCRQEIARIAAVAATCHICCIFEFVDTLCVVSLCCRRLYSAIPAPCSSRFCSGELGLYVRDIILGVNDGTVSMFNLLIGVTGGNSCRREVSDTAAAAAAPP
jgi:hypothetical protein